MTTPVTVSNNAAPGGKHINVATKDTASNGGVATVLNGGPLAPGDSLQCSVDAGHELIVTEA